MQPIYEKTETNNESKTVLIPLMTLNMEIQKEFHCGLLDFCIDLF